MAGLTNAQIAFGRVMVPVRVVPKMSTKEGTVPFKNLHLDCGRPINQDKVCRGCPAHDGETVTLSADDLVKGFEVSKGNFVQVSSEEVEAASSQRSSVIVIHKFVERPDEMWVDKTYWLASGPLTERRYATFCDALESSKQVALGSAALWGKERPVYVSAHLRVLSLSVLHTLPELNECPAPVAATPDRNELRFMKETIRTWSVPIEDADMVVKADVRMKEMIGAKIAGEEWVAPAAEPVLAPTGDLMAELRVTMEMAPKKAA